MQLQQEDLVPIFAGAVVVDALFLLLNYGGVIFVSRRLTEWYLHFRVSAMALDVIIIGAVVSVGVGISDAAFDSPTIGHALACSVGLQLVHDPIFYLVFSSTPRGVVYIFDVFKDYADEVKYHAVWSDSLMVAGTLLLAEGVAGLPAHWQRMLLFASVYFGLFALYSRKDDTNESRVTDVAVLSQTVAARERAAARR